MDLQCAWARYAWANKILTRSDAGCQQNRGLPAKAADGGSFRNSGLQAQKQHSIFPTATFISAMLFLNESRKGKTVSSGCSDPIKMRKKSKDSTSLQGPIPPLEPFCAGWGRGLPAWWLEAIIGEPWCRWHLQL